MKRFDVKDGYAIVNILPKHNIIPIIITGRKSKILENRCEELNIKYLVQNSKDKVKDMKDILQQLGIGLEETAYIGDGLNDIEAMKMVAVKGCPSDAVREITEISDFISVRMGGNGAVRQFIEYIIKM